MHDPSTCEHKHVFYHQLVPLYLIHFPLSLQYATILSQGDQEANLNPWVSVPFESQNHYVSLREICPQ